MSCLLRFPSHECHYSQIRGKIGWRICIRSVLVFSIYPRSWRCHQRLGSRNSRNENWRQAETGRSAEAGIWKTRVLTRHSARCNTAFCGNLEIHWPKGCLKCTYISAPYHAKALGRVGWLFVYSCRTRNLVEAKLYFAVAPSNYSRYLHTKISCY